MNEQTEKETRKEERICGKMARRRKEEKAEMRA